MKLKISVPEVVDIFKEIKEQPYLLDASSATRLFISFDGESEPCFISLRSINSHGYVLKVEMYSNKLYKQNH